MKPTKEEKWSKAIIDCYHTKKNVKKNAEYSNEGYTDETDEE